MHFSVFPKKLLDVLDKFTHPHFVNSKQKRATIKISYFKPVFFYTPPPVYVFIMLDQLYIYNIYINIYIRVVVKN